MPKIHQRRVIASINMQDFSRSRASSSSQQAPLLSPASSSGSSSDHNTKSDGDGRGATYGSTSGKKGSIVAVNPPQDGYSHDDEGNYDEAVEEDEDEAADGRARPRSSSLHGGIQQANAINQVWSKGALITAYLFIFLCSFTNALQWQIIFNLMPYVVSEFSSHSLIPTIAIVSSLLSGILKLPVAKIIDSWGRAQGFAAMTLLASLGSMLMASCQGIRTYAAAQVLYSVGISGFSYILEIIVADTSSLKNRTLAMAFSSTPYLFTSLIGPVIASPFAENGRWRWAFAVTSVALVIFSLPLFCILIINMRKAKRLGLLDDSKPEPWSKRRIQRYLVDFDAFGISLLSLGMTFILVPLSITSKSTYSTSGNAYMATIFLGLAFVVWFGFHERQAKKPFIAFALLCSRNVAGAFVLSMTIFVAYFAWDGYYTSYLQVVHGLSITQAGYVGQIYSIGSSLWGIVVGYLIRKSDRFKWLAVVALPVHIIGGILMIFFRRPETNIIIVVLCQVLLTVGGSTLVMCEQMAVMAVASHAELASAMAILSLATYVGSAMGSSLSGAIWNSTLPVALAELLPELGPVELDRIASDLKKQLSYPMGSPTRSAIVAAYAKSQLRMCIVGSLISLLEIGAVLVWRDVKLSQSKQVRGTVF
ncbi:putative siderophore iron transporter [Rosellinia necatrix]|uniref:Putative siderophore iron transporter n=1 Tax=Rosellinia necatrix TaxID=77044 RepID=A0A1W2TRF0_ROSNE|nr:putative siderophore iron transporter [Rosellinia necatrix]